VSDQGRWFKVWVSILDDLDFQDLSLEDIGRWTLLGALTKLVGEQGRLPINGSGRKLCELLRVDTMDDVKACINRLPNVSFEEGKTRYGARVVTWRNWLKYQVDGSVAQRMKTLRSKRRGDEKRGDETSTTPSRGPSLASLQDRRERRETACRLIDFLNEKTGRSYRKVEANLRLIIARLDDGASEANCRGVIARKVREWHGTEMVQYLRPETLFNRTKFESYLGERTAEVAHADMSPVQ